jgi:NAD(P)-dependent dehydrogenase (short-subunit alcohol dehydrogenase family)
MAEKDFDGKVVLVTGAASGIGAACATAFAERGARLALMDLNTGMLEARYAAAAGELGGSGHLVFGLDITDAEAVEAALDAVAEKWGRVDNLVNCAASFLNAGRDATRQEWERSLGVNVIASSMLTGRVSRMMPRGSAVVNISSISAHVAQPERWTYNATKAAILAMSRGQALDLARDGIRVNAVSPGWIWTPEVDKAAGGDRARWEPIWGKFHMLERLGEPSEVADAVVFLSSTRASFITGAELLVDGGYSAMGPEGLGDDAHFAGSDSRAGQ